MLGSDTLSMDNPLSRSNCTYLSPRSTPLLNELQQGSPGFGYAVLISTAFSGLYTHMVGNHPAGWSTVEDKVNVGFVSFTTFSTTGGRMYYPINQVFVYKVVTTEHPLDHLLERRLSRRFPKAMPWSQKDSGTHWAFMFPSPTSV